MRRRVMPSLRAGDKRVLPRIEYGAYVRDGVLARDDLRASVLEHVLGAGGGIILGGLGTDHDSEEFRDLLLSLQETERAGAGRERMDRFVEVEQRDDIITDEATFFQFPYKSGRALPCHTDTSFIPEPFDLVALHCIRNDPAGGRTVLVRLPDLLARLDTRVQRALLDVPVPFEFGEATVLRREPWGMSIRYNRREIDPYCGPGGLGPMGEVLDLLDRALEFDKASEVLDLRPGECLLVDNRRVLHGRTQLSPGNSRLMVRGRCYVGGGERRRL